MDNLFNLRKQIDQLDTEVLKLLANRLEIAKKVAKYKKSNSINRYQAKREGEMIIERKKIAYELGLREEYVENLFQLLLSESHLVQKNILNDTTCITDKTLLDYCGVDLDELSFQEKKLDLNTSIFNIFTCISANFQDFFFLESSEDNNHGANYSYIGFGSKALIQARGKKLFINHQEINCNGNPFKFLKDNFPQDLILGKTGFCGGLVGYNSYESLQYIEEDLDIFAVNDEFYDFEFGLYLDGLRYNLTTGELNYFTWCEDRSHEIINILQSPVDLLDAVIEGEGSNFTELEYQNIVKDLLSEIKKGNVFQILPTRKFFFKIKGSALSLYKKLRKLNPSPYMFFLKFNNRQIIGSSPELVASVQGRHVETYPIAGTRSRGKDKRGDLELEKDLLNDEKENAEHIMLVDMARDDLGRVCEYGTVKVDEFRMIKKFSHVQHMVSQVSGILKKDKDMFDAVITSSPMGTVSGAPRIEAMRILAKIEQTPRGPYAGNIGYFSFSGEAMAALTIRSLFINDQKGYTQAGAGVVYDSVPKNEEKEVKKKLEAVFKVLGLN